MSSVLAKRFNPENHFFSILSLICLTYLLIEYIYIPYAIFSLDDFWLAHQNYKYLHGLPYRDFLPYKTVFGYYVFLPPFLLIHGSLSPLIFAKLWIALINVFFIAGLAIWLKQFFSTPAVLSALILVIFTPVFLCSSIDIRVDLLAFWFCLIAILFLLEERYILAGLSLGLSFLICQKTAWYIIATNLGLIMQWLFTERSWKKAKAILIFNLSAFLILSAYILFWAYFSSVYVVIQSVFYEPVLLAAVKRYTASLEGYWGLNINNNPGYVLLWPLVLYGIAILPVKNKIFILSYALCISFFILSCRQPFPYFLIAAVPVLFLGYSVFFTAVYRQKSLNPFIKKYKVSTLLFSLFYLIFLLFLSYRFALANIYLLSALIPLLLCAIALNNHPSDHISPIVITGIFIGIIFPLATFIQLLPEHNGQYQKATIHKMESLLKNGGTYLAGAPLLESIAQPIPGLVHLTGTSLDYLYNPSKADYPTITLSSLDFSPDTVEQIIQAIKKAPIKLYVDNNRFHYLPPAIHHYLESQYQHYWGSIYLYAPKLPRGQQRIKLKFSGSYLIVAPKDVQIFLDHKKIRPGLIIYLNQGSYHSESDEDYRLKLLPTQEKNEPEDNLWQKVLG